MDDVKRSKIGFAGSLLIHILFLVVLAITGILRCNNIRQDIIEVAFVGGGGGGGNGLLNAEEDSLPQGEKGASLIESMADISEINDIHIEKNITQNIAVDSRHIVERNISKIEHNNGSKNGIGNGNGSGIGSGSGSGSGGGHGSGRGTGSGSGVGSGNGIAINPAVPPRLVSSISPTYPESQRRANITGTTYIRLLIGTDGVVQSADVLESSGSNALDSSAIVACRKWRFTSARDSNGSKVRCYLDIPIRFDLK